jgi:tRNA-dihydrouridine synthase
MWAAMVVDDTVAFTENIDNCLAYDQETQPIICQIGGNFPAMPGSATQIVQQTTSGYTEVNLNIDCSSKRLSGKPKFGDILMKKVDTAVSVVESMRQHVLGPISLK